MLDWSPAKLFLTIDEFILDTFTRIEPDGTERPLGRPDEIGGGGTYGMSLRVEALRGNPG